MPAREGHPHRRSLADLNVLARGLLEYETLTGDEIIALLKGIPPVRTPYEEPVLPSPRRGHLRPGGRQAARPQVRARSSRPSRSRDIDDPCQMC